MKFPFLYSLVIPIYNSEKSIALLLSTINEELKKDSFEVILVDDGSKDKSWDTLRSFKKKHVVYPLTLVKLTKNNGQHAALLCGLQFAKGEYIILLDDDLQHHPSEIKKLLECAKKENADVVYGVYEEKQHSVVRKFGSNMFGNIFSKFANTPNKGSSFKLVNHSLLNDIISHSHSNMYLDEILAWFSKKTAFQTIQHYKRKIGHSNYNFFKLLSLSAKYFFNYTSIPLKGIIYVGITASLVSFAIGIYFIFLKYTQNVPLGFSALIVSILFSTGLILLSLGIIGEYLSRLLSIQTGKPPYIIEEIIE